jgi:hypothetical protein
LGECLPSSRQIDGTVRLVKIDKEEKENKKDMRGKVGEIHRNWSGVLWKEEDDSLCEANSRWSWRSQDLHCSWP